MKTIDYYRKRRRIAIIALGNQCAKCGGDGPFDIDHIDPSTKTINLGTDWYNVGWWEELITRCQLLCKSCHKEKSAQESRVRMLAKGFTHGTTYGWMKTKCKCDLCLAKKAAFNEARNAARRIPEGRGKRGPYNLPVEHGTKRMYSRGCKCDPCKAANAAYAKMLRESRPRGETENAESLKDSGYGLAGANPAGGTKIIYEYVDDFPEEH
jgi:hypothetical protein